MVGLKKDRLKDDLVTWISNLQGISAKDSNWLIELQKLISSRNLPHQSKKNNLTREERVSMLIGLIILALPAVENFPENAESLILFSEKYGLLPKSKLEALKAKIDLQKKPSTPRF